MRQDSYGVEVLTRIVSWISSMQLLGKLLVRVCLNAQRLVDGQDLEQER